MKNIYTIGIGKTGKAQEVDFGAMNEDVRDYVIAYGLKQILNDCHASIQRKDYDEQGEFILAVEEAVNDKLAALASGKISIRTGAARESIDPVQKLVNRMAREIVLGAIKAKGLKAKDISKESMDKLIADYATANHDALTKEAKAQLKKAEGLAVDLSALGL